MTGFGRSPHYIPAWSLRRAAGRSKKSSYSATSSKPLGCAISATQVQHTILPEFVVRGIMIRKTYAMKCCECRVQVFRELRRRDCQHQASVTGPVMSTRLCDVADLQLLSSQRIALLNVKCFVSLIGEIEIERRARPVSHDHTLKLQQDPTTADASVELKSRTRYRQSGFLTHGRTTERTDENEPL